MDQPPATPEDATRDVLVPPAESGGWRSWRPPPRVLVLALIVAAILIPLAEPSISPTDPLYNERLATQHTEYDPDTANAILDTLLPEKDGEGYRLD